MEFARGRVKAPGRIEDYMEELERNFMGHLDQGPPTGGAENQSRQDQNRYLVRRKSGVAVEVYDIS